MLHHRCRVEMEQELSTLKYVIWDDEIYAARWRANIAIIYCEILKEKVQNENFTDDPYWVERIKQAEADAAAKREKYEIILCQKSSTQQRGGKVK